ncbi:hypothetical protein EHI8A_091990 [Entamoeba histolytica HM-1:IMSS-B]|uniref:Uncharacterized protein n=6 Tax=Entamoeba histolytica TaxID=5759 RepID=C4M3X6_ENTH1|nr:hypothetical protein EHI_200700 [Entamoeba histolytica HM-1:IMSS]EMD45295.1 Hypothetical protein EHI5A_128640 [Entamoeba histolytica KU27]EMH75138.1 hypothetical protein EHI8A_091990 [Entamoeba histolytica HM-1:IMSS-B]ENY59972.1 hypothetical protein EHI7A_089270 [Entamoeba histolytica HM-1:IMSS-A]GAT96042.1 hypothetical protein CL6EHI_200700 [Entamoeba histolytica]EAL47286.2 hypothetical protein EHI_200700 [Entamoeba histolytica HM-1:IMSS]|eukprot:XP_652672.2 hypothetical protein EHI_200700 [Entamoeba histolytica HM-1:IMSS]
MLYPSDTKNSYPMTNESIAGIAIYLFLFILVIIQFVHTLYMSHKRYNRVRLTISRSLYYSFVVTYLFLMLFVFSLMLYSSKQSCFLYIIQRLTESICCYLFITAFTVCLFDYYDHRSGGNVAVMKNRFIIPIIVYTVNTVFLILVCAQLIYYVSLEGECDPTLPNRSWAYLSIPFTIINQQFIVLVIFGGVAVWLVYSHRNLKVSLKIDKMYFVYFLKFGIAIGIHLSILILKLLFSVLVSVETYVISLKYLCCDPLNCFALFVLTTYTLGQDDKRESRYYQSLQTEDRF